MPSFNYRKQRSRLFGKVFRPLIELEAYSEVANDWLILENILADTGADVSMLPKSIGEALVQDIERGKRTQIKGVVPGAKLNVYIHNLRFRLNSKQFYLPVAIADSDAVPPILGRAKGLDLFNAIFKKGKILQL
ncbi:MAG: hypothetical protein ACRD5H_03700 [Nitrososphaerales archaeon]